LLGGIQVPSPRQTTRARRGYEDEHITTLLTGADHFSAFRKPVPSIISHRSHDDWDDAPEVEARLREAIEEMGDELLAEWVATKPGTRPWFWWRFIAPEPRQCLTGPHRYTRPEYARVPHRYYFGVPRFAMAPEFGAGEEYESERDYLERLDLLTDHERNLITATP
jgi:hypothetical protein